MLHFREEIRSIAWLQGRRKECQVLDSGFGAAYIVYAPSTTTVASIRRWPIDHIVSFQRIGYGATTPLPPPGNEGTRARRIRMAHRSRGLKEAFFSIAATL
eukprot:GHVO01012681.1.p2 GENE.GHVO01012681.1~~GHVO01012681.1.p2  ORF type:complete len:101 (+),score=8.68 GHVO01012681.1:237-539(+)